MNVLVRGRGAVLGAHTSLLKTLANKHRATVTKMAGKYKATIETPNGTRKCLQVTVNATGDEGHWSPVSAGSLRRQRTAVLLDQRPVMASAKRNELIHRLLAERCEICEARGNLEVHHIRKLADLNKPGRREKPAWMHLMAKRRRKTERFPVAGGRSGSDTAMAWR